MNLILPPSFYTNSPELVAQKLLGKYLVRNTGSEFLIGKIVETEAYLSDADEAAHGFRGKDARNKSLYLSGGHAYVHQLRHHYLIDIVTEESDIPSSVLLRAIEPVEGTGLMKKFRNTKDEKNVGSGPGKLTQALQIDMSLDGINVTNPTSPLFITEGECIPDSEIRISPRIGISKSADKLLRFSIKNNPYVSN